MSSNPGAHMKRKSIVNSMNSYNNLTIICCECLLFNDYERNYRNKKSIATGNKLQLGCFPSSVQNKYERKDSYGLVVFLTLGSRYSS